MTKKLYFFIDKINQYIKNNFFRFTDVIRGPNVIVEIDESKFGKRKYCIGHKVDGVWILGLVERTPDRRIVLIPVKNRNKDTLTQIIYNHMHPGSIIYTDCWKGYSDLKNYFIHETVNHSRSFVNPLNGVHTNTIEGNWSVVKKYLF